MNDFLTIERDGAVLTVTMNRPDDRNAITDPEQSAEFVALAESLARGDALGGIDAAHRFETQFGAALHAPGRADLPGAPGLDALHATFRDIRPGDRYALNFNTDSGLTLEVNGKPVFTSPDQELAKAYLGIWLSPNGLSDSVRTSLLAD